MDDFSAPSFSLGLDDVPQAPSFSLGLDLDLDLDPDPDPAELPTEGEEDEPELPIFSGAEPPANDLEDFDEDPCPHTLDPAEDPPPVLKRLRRGSGPSARRPPAAGNGEGKRASVEFLNADDDIEDFSSPEKRWNQDEYTSLPSHTACSTSKFSLHSRGLLMSQPAKKLKDSKISPPSNASTSTNIGTSSNGELFPKLTISPLRKFCLVDSDSDSPSSKDIHKDTKEVNASLKMRQFTSSQAATKNVEKTTFQYNKVQTESFWKDFGPKKDVNLATPVLDEFCEEYFRSEKDTKVDQRKEEDTSFISSRVLDPDEFMDDFQQKSVTRKNDISGNSHHPQPPAYQYFNHNDDRIRALVQERFRYFVPLGAEKYRGNQQSTTESLDYMGQFGTTHVPSRARGTPKSTAENLDYMSQFGTRHVPSRARETHEKGSEGSSRNKRKRPNTTKTKESSHSTEGWVNPKSSTTIPKDAGKRRVSADVKQQSGQWFTGQDGRKVYVTKNGQELTGRAAYTHYKKDKGGFGKARKKTATRKRK